MLQRQCAIPTKVNSITGGTCRWHGTTYEIIIYDNEQDDICASESSLFFLHKRIPFLQSVLPCKLDPHTSHMMNALSGDKNEVLGDIWFIYDSIIPCDKWPPGYKSGILALLKGKIPEGDGFNMLHFDTVTGLI